MIWGHRDGQLDSQIVLRKGGSVADVARWAAAKSEDSEGAPNLGLPESGGLGVRERAEFAGTMLDDVTREPGQSSGFGPGSG